VKAGFAKVTTPNKDVDYYKEYYHELQSDQILAQSKKLKIWKDYAPKEEAEKKKNTVAYKTEDKNFTARVVEVHSGDSLTIESEEPAALFTKRVFLPSLRAPAMARKQGDEDEMWAWESKEFLRKQVIGKKVRVEMEFQKTIPMKQGEKEGERNMEFASVFVHKNDKNVSIASIEKGFSKVAVAKFNDESSKYFEQMIEAETVAKKSKLGMHSGQQAPMHIFTDLISQPKKLQTFEATLMKKGRAGNNLTGVIEYCFSGQRFKVRIESESVCIPLCIHGIRCMTYDQNQPQAMELANEGKDFAKWNLHQKDVTIELEFTDKKGNFFGSVLVGKKNYGEMILEQGLA
jgi:staphylococcal nuclease domain-containing protein 1